MIRKFVSRSTFFVWARLNMLNFHSTYYISFLFAMGCVQGSLSIMSGAKRSRKARSTNDVLQSKIKLALAKKVEEQAKLEHPITLVRYYNCCIGVYFAGSLRFFSVRYFGFCLKHHSIKLFSHLLHEYFCYSCHCICIRF